ncbi:S8 family peptidase [Pseudaestuariivita rosea]|uniref:S8 family peptidase n=1 Tax=Pseudaestuariivita rosea TaxID=2763263 RepID=UPI001ABBD032|nr:S8 family serine peptidase [Pseudaestuariivita rosea]
MQNKRLDLQRPRPTGGSVVSFQPGVDLKTQQSILADLAGSNIRSYVPRSGHFPDEASDMAAVILEHMNIGFISEHLGLSENSNIRSKLKDDDRVRSVRPEFYFFALDTFQDDDDKTWGVDAVGAWTSSFTGAGIKVAILDTGLDLQHPDYQGRTIISESFVRGQSVQDGQGHGTHCAGTAVGGTVTGNGFRYGVASEADLYVAKVLGDNGSGRERDILTGMAWAIEQGCEVISMSLGAAVREGETFIPEYEDLARMALDNGCLIIAAAGNESSRAFGFIAPVGSPANAPSIMAVAAVDQALAVAEFSSGGINPDGGEVDIAGPGVGVFSSTPTPQLYATLSGTSMACPHVAGAAALWAQSDPNLRGRALWDRLVQTAQPLNDSVRDIGAGLVQVPGPLS